MSKIYQRANVFDPFPSANVLSSLPLYHLSAPPPRPLFIIYINTFHNITKPQTAVMLIINNLSQILLTRAPFIRKYTFINCKHDIRDENHK